MRTPGDRYAALFQRTRREDRPALVPFWMLGDPTPERSRAAIEALIGAGADALELGLPFSDPVADGVVIQGAADRALRAGTTFRTALALVAGLRARHPRLPIGLLAYLNPFEALGLPRALAACADAGVDSLLLADLPTTECAPYATAIRDAGIAPVLIVPPNATSAAIATVARHGAGYSYLTGRAGVTGTHAAMAAPTATLIAALRDAGAPTALVGFGVTTAEQVRAAHHAGAAGAIVGSALVELGDDAPALVRRFRALGACATTTASA